MKRQNLLAFAKERLKTDIAFDVIASLYLAFCLATTIYMGVIGVTATCIRAAAFMLFAPIILLAEWVLRLKMAPALLALLLIIPTGSLLGGAGYNLYTIIPFFDTILHGTSGVVFACIGFALLKVFVGEPKHAKSFLACLFVGFIFAAAIASLWELFEYVAHLVTGLDIEEDTLITGFRSFFLSGDHNNPEILEGIKQTLIVLEDGTIYPIDGGYLDIGLIDTITDMAICCGGAALVSIVIALDWFLDRKKALYRFLIPQYTGEKEPPQTEEREESAAA